MEVPSSSIFNPRRGGLKETWSQSNSGNYLVTAWSLSGGDLSLDFIPKMISSHLIASFPLY